MSKALSLFVTASLAVCISCSKQEMQTGGQAHGSLEQGDFDYITALGPGSHSKTVVSNGTKVLWSDADEIGLYAEGPATSVFKTSLEEPSAQARFGRSSNDKAAQAGDGRYYAVYPAAAIVQWSAPAEGASAPAPFCSVNVPKLQIAEPGSWDKKAAILVANSQTNTLAFKHAVAYLRFEVTAQTGSFAQVRALSNNNEMLSDSQAGVKSLASNSVELVSSSSAVDYVTLQHAAADTVFAEGVYYIAVLPGNYTQGLTLSFIDSDGKVAEESIAALTLNPGEVADWGPIPALTFAAAAAPLEKCTLFVENNENLGVVFWVNPRKPEEGKIVSGEAKKLKWHVTTEFFNDAENFDTSDSKANNDYITSWADYKADKTKYPAVYFCDTLRGGGWRLPSRDEFDELYRAWTDYEGELVGNTAYHTTTTGAAAAAKLDGLLSQCVTGSKIAMEATTWYWTGQADISNNKIRRTKVSSNYMSSSAKATGENWVRCVRDVKSSGDQTPNNDPTTNNKKKVSLVGDSITTFAGTLVTNFADSENGGAYYPTGTVTSVTDQYWYKLINSKMSNAALDANNSLRGSMVTRRQETGYEGKDFSSRVATYGLGDPYLVLIHGGTNDCTIHSASYLYRPGLYRADLLLSDAFLAGSYTDDNRFVGNAAYESEPYKGMMPGTIPSDNEFNTVFTRAEAASTWSEIQALEDRSFIHAYVKLLNMVHFKYPNAKVVMIIPDYITNQCWQSLKKIGDHYGQKYGYKYVDFYTDGNSNPNISKVSGAHPDGAGFTYMANKIYQETGSYIDPE